MSCGLTLLVSPRNIIRLSRKKYRVPLPPSQARPTEFVPVPPDNFFQIYTYLYVDVYLSQTTTNLAQIGNRN